MTASSIMITRFKCLFVLSVLAILGIGPLPTTSLLGFYVVLARPPWFKDLILRLYAEGEHTDSEG